MLNNSQKSRLRLLACMCCFVSGGALLCGPQASDSFGHAMRNVQMSAQSHIVMPSRIFLISERASSNMIGTIMTLLATFDEAGILPPEGTAQANQIIHGLIQLQSMLMKSNSVELAAYQRASQDFWSKQHPNRQDGVWEDEGLTLRVLEALIAQDQKYPMWKDPQIASAMKVFNVSQADWLFIVQLFNKANVVFRDQGRSIHAVYDAWRLKFSGGKS